MPLLSLSLVGRLEGSTASNSIPKDRIQRIKGFIAHGNSDDELTAAGDFSLNVFMMQEAVLYWNSSS